MPTVTVEVRGIEVELDVYGEVESGGSNCYGSTEPEWTEVNEIELWNPVRMREISPKLYKEIISTYEDYITEAILEGDV